MFAHSSVAGEHPVSTRSQEEIGKDIPVRVDVGLLFISRVRERTNDKLLHSTLRDFLDGRSLAGNNDRMMLNAAITNVLSDWSAVGVVAGKTLCSMTVRSEESGNFETTHRMEKWTFPSEQAGGGTDEAPSFDHGIGLENKGTRLLDDKQISVSFSLTIAGKPELKTRNNGSVSVVQDRRTAIPEFRIESGQSTVLASEDFDPDSAKRLFGLFREEGWLQFDAGWNPEEEELAFLILVGAERGEE